MQVSTQFTLMISFSFALTALYIAIARRDKPTCLAGVVVTLACALVTLAHALQGLSVTLAARMFWNKMVHVGFTIMPTAFLALAVRYAGLGYMLTWRTRILLSLFPALTTGLILSNESHGLLWDPEHTADIINSMTLLPVRDANIWYWLHVTYCYLMLGLGCILLARLAVQSRKMYGWQVGGVISATVIAMLGPLLDIFEISPLGPFVSTALSLAVGIVTVVLILTFLRRRDLLVLSRTAIMDSIRDSIVVVDASNVIAVLNPAAEQLIGQSAKEAIGKPLEQICPKLRFIQTNLTDTRAEAILNIEDMPRTFDIRTYSIRDKQARTTSRVIVLRDITDRKRADKALQQSERTYRLHFENVLDIIFSYDCALKITSISPSIEKTLGYTPDELLGKTIPEVNILAPEHLEVALSDVLQVLSGECKTAQYEFIAKDGTRIVGELTGSPIYSQDGQIVGVISVARDITERKQAEVERERLVMELEAKNAELERFTYTVSHDLKSPLITIGGFLSFLRQDILSSDLERARNDISHINDAVKKMKRLLDELLELSRIGRLVNPTETVSFTDIAHEAVALAQGQIAASGVVVDVASNLPLVYGDRVRLVEVVQNLVDNACKFMGDQSDPRIEIGMRQAGDALVFYVRDNGIGIDPRYHDRVFALFEKLDVDSEGTGIGLALVKRIVETHGGRIWVESAGRNRGSTFLFTIADVER